MYLYIPNLWRSKIYYFFTLKGMLNLHKWKTQFRSHYGILHKIWYGPFYFQFPWNQKEFKVWLGTYSTHLPHNCLDYMMQHQELHKGKQISPWLFHTHLSLTRNFVFTVISRWGFIGFMHSFQSGKEKW